VTPEDEWPDHHVEVIAAFKKHQEEILDILDDEEQKEYQSFMQDTFKLNFDGRNFSDEAIGFLDETGNGLHSQLQTLFFSAGAWNEMNAVDPERGNKFIEINSKYVNYYGNGANILYPTRKAFSSYPLPALAEFIIEVWGLYDDAETQCHVNFYYGDAFSGIVDCITVDCDLYKLNQGVDFSSNESTLNDVNLMWEDYGNRLILHLYNLADNTDEHWAGSSDDIGNEDSLSAAIKTIIGTTITNLMKWKMIIDATSVIPNIPTPKINLKYFSEDILTYIEKAYAAIDAAYDASTKTYNSTEVENLAGAYIKEAEADFNNNINIINKSIKLMKNYETLRQLNFDDNLDLKHLVDRKILNQINNKLNSKVRPPEPKKEIIEEKLIPIQSIGIARSIPRNNKSINLSEKIKNLPLSLQMEIKKK
jgi:hypothetical protein